MKSYKLLLRSAVGTQNSVIINRLNRNNALKQIKQKNKQRARPGVLTGSASTVMYELTIPYGYCTCSTYMNASSI